MWWLRTLVLSLLPLGKADSESYGNASPKDFRLMIVKEVARLTNLSVLVDNQDGCEFHLVFNIPSPSERLH